MFADFLAVGIFQERGKREMEFEGRIVYRTCKGKCEKKVPRHLMNPDGSCFECGEAILEGTHPTRKAKHKHNDCKVYGDADLEWFGSNYVGSSSWCN